jgi:ubiquinone/menaquinone biosynthesis C-methylase UbiE
MIVADVYMYGCCCCCRVLDVAGGTGDIAFRIMDQMMPHLDNHEPVSAHPLVTVSDINPNMLEVLQPKIDLYIFSYMCLRLTSYSYAHA